MFLKQFYDPLVFGYASVPLVVALTVFVLFCEVPKMCHVLSANGSQEIAGIQYDVCALHLKTVLAVEKLGTLGPEASTR
jgi:hypothetical protein